MSKVAPAGHYYRSRRKTWRVSNVSGFFKVAEDYAVHASLKTSLLCPTAYLIRKVGWYRLVVKPPPEKAEVATVEARGPSSLLLNSILCSRKFPTYSKID